MTQLNKIIKSVLDEQVVKFSDKQKDLKIAKQIYDSKGLLWDDPKGTVSAIKQIKTADQFNKVNRELMTLTNGRDFATYLKSFLDKSDNQTWISILSYLKKQFKGNEVDILYPVGKVYFNIMNNFGPTGMTGIGSEYVSPDYIKWYKNQSVKYTSGISTSPLSTIGKTAYEYRHEIALVLQIGASFVPIVGWAVAAGIGIGNAKMYYDEGDSKSAGLEAIFALLPGLGIAGKLGIKNVAPQFMANLGKKVALNQTKTLTKQELRILNAIATQKKTVSAELDNLIKASIAKNAKQISKDKLAAAGKKYGLGLAKTSGTLGSAIAIAQLYSNIYDANVELINDTELLALNTKLDAAFEQWLELRNGGTVADGVVNKTNSNTLNEGNWFTNILFGISDAAQAHPVMLVGGVLTYKLFGKQIGKFLSKWNPKVRFRTWNKMQRDKNTFKALGWNPGKIKEFYKSGAALETAKKQWAEVEAEVAAGRLSPRDAMQQLTHLEKPGVANKVFNGLTKSYNKATTVKGDFHQDLKIFLKDIPKPEKPGAGFGKQEIYDAEMKIWKNQNEWPVYYKRLEAIREDPEYMEWFTKHLQNQTATKNLKWVNNKRLAKYAAFWTLVGGAAGLKTYFFINAWKDRVKKRAYKRQLDSAEKTPVYFKAAVGTRIPLYTWIAQNKTWKYVNLKYTIESNAKILKVKESADKTHTLIQFPGEKYYWVLTNTLSTTPAVKKKPVTPKKVEPVIVKEPVEKETPIVTPEPLVQPLPAPEYD